MLEKNHVSETRLITLFPPSHVEADEGSFVGGFVWYMFLRPLKAVPYVRVKRAAYCCC